MTRLRVLTSRLALALASGLALYALVALAAALVPITGRIQAVAQDEPKIFVCASLAHTDILMPIVDEIADWAGAFPEIGSFASPGIYVAIGWGDLDVYRNTPRWSDLRPGVVFRAIAGLGPTTLHVVAVRAPVGVSGCVAARPDREGRAALARFIFATAQMDAGGAAILISSPRRGEAFYAARGHYSPLRTCNVWASEALAAAGLPTAAWAPFSFGVTWPLARAPAN